MRSFLLVILVLFISLVGLPVIFNFFFFEESIYSNGATTDWFTLYGGIFSGLIGGLLTYLGVKLTINHNEKSEKVKSKPRLEVLDHRLLLRGGHIYEERDEIVISIQNFGGTIAKNIEATINFDNFELLTEKVHEVLKDKIKPPVKVTSREFTLADSDKKAAYLVLENTSVNDKIMDLHYGTINQVYYRMIGNCVPININYDANVEIKLPKDVHGWIAFFSGYSQYDYFAEGLFDMTLMLKYFSIENEAYEKKFSLKFIDTKTYESVDGMVEKLIVLRATEIK